MPCGFFLLVFAGLALAGPAAAHGVGWSERAADPAKVIAFAYSDGEPMAFATIRVKAPDGSIFQQGHADRTGVFAFVPAAPGDWTVEAKDGMGHRAVARINAAAGITTVKPDPPTPSVIRTLLGLSLILNLAFAARFLLSRNARRPAPR